MATSAMENNQEHHLPATIKNAPRKSIEKNIPTQTKPTTIANLPEPRKPSSLFLSRKTLSHRIYRRASQAIQDLSSRNYKFAIAFVILLLLVIVLSCAVFIYDVMTNHPTIHVVRGKFGVVQGFISASTDKHVVYEYLGIPYAIPPLGELRFREPQPLNVSTMTLFKPLKNGSICIQNNFTLNNIQVQFSVKPSEDCLHLNIWSPKCTRNSENRCTGEFPVIILLGGIGFQNNMFSMYKANQLALHGNVMVVVPNYRLGAFGFLYANSSKIPMSNAGLADQILAIKWILEHAADFGGDASNVLLVGHASGATSISILLSNKHSVLNNMKRFILLSENVLSKQLDNTKSAVNNFRELVAAAECPARSVECLQKLSAESLLAYAKDLHEDIRFVPTFGTDLLPIVPQNFFGINDIREKEFLLGNTMLDATQTKCDLYGTDTFLNLEQRRNEKSPELFHALGIAGFKSISDFYSTSDLNFQPIRRNCKAMSDILYTCPMFYFAEKLAYYGNRVFKFVLGHRVSRESNETSSLFYDDVSLILGQSLISNYSPLSQDDKELSTRMMDMVLSFLKDGSLPTVRGDGTPWPTFDYKTYKSVVVMKDHDWVYPAYKQKECAFLKPFLLNDTRYLSLADVFRRHDLRRSFRRKIKNTY